MVVGSALVVATGGVILDVGPVHPAPAALETVVVDLVLPGSPAEPDGVPGRSRQSAGAVGKSVSPDASPDRLSRARLEEAAGDSGAPSSPTSTIDSPAPGHEAVTIANAEPAPDAPRAAQPGGAVTIANAEPASGTPRAAQPDDAARGAVTVAHAKPAPRSASTTPSIDPPGGTTAPVDTEAPAARAPAHRVTVNSGDSLYLIFKRLGLPQRDLAMMTGSKPLRKKLARLAPGQEIEFYVDTQSRLTRLVHQLDRIRSLHVSRDGDTFTFEEVVEPPEVAVAAVTGVIDSSLFEAGQRAGLSDAIIMQMAEIFGWDVDFALDIRAGDRFALIYEKQLKDGEEIGEGPIIAAEFMNRGRRLRALRYVDPTGHTEYFSEDGRSMRKAFLRTPVNFTRISSRFSFSRRHPILHKMRAHRGVDYAAPRGTAVKASGDGKVVFAGRKGGYGRTIILRHGSTYTTLYAHLSRFSKGIRSGKRVVQGQTIGYVGSTGLATGPHLHYEFRVRGTHRDPLKVKLPQAAPLAQGYMADFREKAKPLLAKLDLIGRTSIATAD